MSINSEKEKGDGALHQDEYLTWETGEPGVRGAPPQT